MLKLDPSPALHGTPSVLLRLMTPPELNARLAELKRAYPNSYRPSTHLDRRFYSTARSEMTRIRRELRRRAQNPTDSNTVVSHLPSGCTVPTSVPAHPVETTDPPFIRGNEFNDRDGFDNQQESTPCAKSASSSLTCDNPGGNQ